MTEMLVENLEHLDFDFAPPCETVYGCDKIAEWKVRLKCCNRLVLFCNNHMEYKKFIMETLIDGFTGWSRCQTCGIRIIDKNPYSMIERLS